MAAALKCPKKHVLNASKTRTPQRKLKCDLCQYNFMEDEDCMTVSRRPLGQGEGTTLPPLSIFNSEQQQTHDNTV